MRMIKHLNNPVLNIHTAAYIVVQYTIYINCTILYYLYLHGNTDFGEVFIRGDWKPGREAEVIKRYFIETGFEKNVHQPHSPQNDATFYRQGRSLALVTHTKCEMSNTSTFLANSRSQKNNLARGWRYDTGRKGNISHGDKIIIASKMRNTLTITLYSRILDIQIVSCPRQSIHQCQF